MKKRVCQHLESLIYFDRVYGAQCSWEICDTCHEEFNFTELSPPDRGSAYVPVPGALLDEWRREHGVPV